MSFIAQKVARKTFSKHAAQYEPEDPHYVTETDAQGRQKRRVRPVPPGLTKQEEKILKKLRKRAHYLDKGVNLCGFKVGWTFFIGFIPMLGDIVNILLGYNLVIKLAKKLDLPESVISKMYVTQGAASGVGFIPLVGDIIFALLKPNWRNAHLVESFLIQRAEKRMAQGTGGTTAGLNGGFTNAEVDNIIDQDSRVAHGHGQPPPISSLPPRPPQQARVR